MTASGNRGAANLVSGAVTVYRSDDFSESRCDGSNQRARGTRQEAELMRIGVLRERTAGERRVALIPDGVARLAKAGHEIRV